MIAYFTVGSPNEAAGFISDRAVQHVGGFGAFLMVGGWMLSPVDP
jgi:hypothetical protein